ncbi:serine hydrolase [Ciceribacter sp. L1K23]|uniref:serine hydrolase domain-containing protein n=1 Tax=Ciceribacter sp. L1K23 TaxID=2820276 RepID=UPI001B844910|nr:serine hydrolase [Ciceribacter sp. L1K23]MBR0555069.1 serine hydrolase [Ciceribacter sp. L1K23]
MRIVGKLLRGLAIGLVVLIIAGLGWLVVSPPSLLLVGTGYAAKMVCSNVFLAGRDAESVLAVDVQAPGHPLLRLVTVNVDRDAGTVRASMLGFIAPSLAVNRPGFGCANVADGDVERARDLPPKDTVSAISDGVWPEGTDVTVTDARIASVLVDASLQGPGMRGVVVVQDGRILGETYGAGFGPDVPLLGWSMTKTVNAAILGRLVLEDRMSLDESNLFSNWKGDPRSAITIRSLLAMEDGLRFNELYGDVTDVTRMLFLEPDMAAFASARPKVEAPGTAFNYSSGTAVLLSRLWMDRIGDRPEALAYPDEALFRPLGMTSAVFETDARGTFVGSSYMYATPRDWARFALFLLQDGMWNGERLLPEGYVAAMAEPTEASGGRYSRMQTWTVGPGFDAREDYGLPPDTFWLQGHDGQTIAIVPSLRLAVLRMGLTPYNKGYRPQLLVKAVIDALN